MRKNCRRCVLKGIGGSTPGQNGKVYPNSVGGRIRGRVGTKGEEFIKADKTKNRRKWNQTR